MNRTTRLTALAALLLPLAAACWSSDRSGAADTSGTTGNASVSTENSGTATSSTSGGTVETATTSTVVPSYADADRAFHRGRYEEAATMFEAYTEHAPDDAWGQYMLGLSAWKNGNHTRALEAFDAALRLDPNHRKSLLNSARVLLETGKPQDALGRVQRALTLEPMSSEGLRLEGRAEYALGQTDRAIDAYQRALAIDDKDVWAMNNLGYIYIQAGQPDSALPPLARAVELRRNVPLFQNNFGTALERAGYFVSAAEAYQAALSADSTYTKAATALERVQANGAQSDTSSVDPAALVQAFQTDVEQWRSRVTTDTVRSASSPSTPVVTDSGSSRPDSSGVPSVADSSPSVVGDSSR